MSQSQLHVVELFAGVGGFRLGLEGWQGRSASSGYTESFDSRYHVVWSNQWEHATKRQHASEVYVARFGMDNHSNNDIASVATDELPDFDMLVGGFPCQDYSVAMQRGQSKGIIGKKGVLWWEIHRIVSARKPKYLLLENVDRLLLSPAAQRGRDFALMLASLSDLGYTVEWRVINAAAYGMPQRRKRVFILGYHAETSIAKAIHCPTGWMFKDGTFARAFNIHAQLNAAISCNELLSDLSELSSDFNRQHHCARPFGNTGIMIDRKVWSVDTEPNHTGRSITLGDIVEPFEHIPGGYFIAESDLARWEYVKGAKRELRRKANGETFYYTEGAVQFPDPLDRPARTIITSEGGKAASRSKHAIKQDGRLRRLTPRDLERLNMFPDGHTARVTDNKRAFLMGNALVVGVVEKAAITLGKLIDAHASSSIYQDRYIAPQNTTNSFAATG